MRTIKQVNSAVSLKLSLRYGTESSAASARFFSAATLLPAEKTLGVQFRFSKGNITNVTAFSDAELELKDYQWMFKPCAEIAEQEQRPSDAEETVTYVLAYSELPITEAETFDQALVDELSELDAVVNFFVQGGGDKACMTIQTSKTIPFRVRVMLSKLLCGAEIKELTECNEDEKEELVLESVLDALSGFLTGVSLKNDRANPPEFLVPEVDGSCTSIDKLDLSVRAYNCLRRAGIKSIEQVKKMDKTDLLHVRNLGGRCTQEVLDQLEKYEKTNQNVEGTLTDDARSGREMLDELTGLADVKAQVKRITALAKMRKNMKDKGMEATAITLNMAFMGNPGTAKTTVARIVAKILYEDGVLSKPEVIEVGRSGLVGGFVGHTALKVKSVFEKAEGGLLFIDEAYSLADDSQNSFGDEAINTIVQEMENNRLKTVVVFAGYPEQMEEFLSRNPGLKSRIPFKIEFPDYSVEEMLEIAELEADRLGFSIQADAMNRVREICEAAHENTENGNGRFCRNLIESAILSFAERRYGDENKSDVAEVEPILTKEDFSDSQGIKSKKKRKIGF